MPEQFKALQGFKDILPEEQPYWQFVEETGSRVAELYGYRRIETPMIEETAIFRRTAGEGTDIVEKEMYSFDDRADKEGNRLNLTVRPEGTAGVVRAYLEHGMFKLPQPVKVYYMSAPMFRHEKPQAGRYREHHQFGCEALGEEDPAIDAEMIGLLYQFYTGLGLQQVNVQINSIGDGNCRPAYIEALQEYYRPLLNDCCDDCKVRFYKNPLRLLDCKELQDQPKIANAPKSYDYLCGPCREHFAAVQRYIEAYHVPFSLNPLLVRGLDYYTRTVFEFTYGDEKLVLNGGGRYDGLAEILGGEHTPGIGFGAGVERIILELKRQNITPPPSAPVIAYIVTLGQNPQVKTAAVQLLAELRHANIKAEMSYGTRGFKGQMKQVKNTDAAYALILGEDELTNNVINVKKQHGTEGEQLQVTLKRSELIPYLLS